MLNRIKLGLSSCHPEPKAAVGVMNEVRLKLFIKQHFICTRVKDRVRELRKIKYCGNSF